MQLHSSVEFTFSIVCFLKIVCLSRSSSSLISIPDLPSFVDERDPNPLYNVLVHNKTRNVIVGGRNVLYQFSADLEQKAKVTTGPLLDNPECPYPSAHSAKCDHRSSTDNDNKVLQLVDYDDQPLLLACGTLYQGLCQVRPLKSLNTPKFAWVGPLNESVAFLAGRSSVVAYTAQDTDGHWSLYSAATYDGRPLTYAAPAVASRVLVKEDKFAFHYAHHTATSLSAVSFDPKYRKNYKVEYISGFSYGGYSYFLTNQKVSPESESFESRLARVCQKDPSFFSYSEVAVKCDRGLDIFNLATAAHMAKASSKMKNRLQLDKILDVLYISFVQTIAEHGSLVNHSMGSVVCSFPMESVVGAFTTAARDCFNAEPRAQLLKHVTGVEMPCRQVTDVEIDDSFCGSGLNNYLEGREALPGGFRAHLPTHVTSLAVTVQHDCTVAAAATRSGHVHKVNLEKRDNPVLYSVDIGEGQTDPEVQRSNAFDPSHENVYFLTGHKVVRFPLGSCSPYRSCGACLGTPDPLGCGWCGGRCAHLQECDRPDTFTKNTCAPLVHQVSPLRGPTEGGTLLTIRGDNFGSSQSGQHATVAVTVAGNPCKLFLWENELVQCHTSPVSGLESGQVQINVTDTDWNQGQYDIKGLAHSDQNFTYVAPKLYGVYPDRGPMSGGTNITLYGELLDAGSGHSILVAGIACVVMQVRDKVAWCITGNHSSPKEAPLPKRGPVLLLMDDAVIEVEGKVPVEGFDHTLSKDFVFLPDPQVFAIHPQATTLSGTVNLTAEGAHLDSVARPEMVVLIAAPLTGEKLEFHEPCWVDPHSNGTRMTCSTPNMAGSREGGPLHAPTGKAPLLAHVSFAMDGVEELRALPHRRRALSQLLVYPDPEYEQFGEVKRITYDQTQLELKGKYLSLAHSPSDVQVKMGGHLCNVSVIEEDSLLCAIPSELVAHRDVSQYMVEVTVGPLHRELGMVELVERETSKLTVIILSLAGVLVCCACVAIYLYCRRVARRKQHPTYMVAYTAERQRSLQGGQETCGGDRRDGGSNDYQDLRGRVLSRQTSAKQTTSAKGVDLERGADEDLDEEEGAMAVDDETMRLLQSENILILRENLILGEVIGVGHFGCVYKGELSIPERNDKTNVAVKTLHSNTSASNHRGDLESFLQEGLMMKDFRHQNVLTLVGVCFEDQGQPMVVIPYMRHGDLLAYIRSEDNAPTVKDLLQFGVQIAAGMSYLADMKFVHRDLAARNCMLDESLGVKVADFGLSRDIYERDYYSSDNKKSKLPVKWMAPESLEKGTYSTKTDVWSFGVVLWELMTRGVSPYPDVDNWDIVHYLKSGRRMPQPSYCPDMLYEIMLSCWLEDSKARPTFSQLEQKVTNVITTLQRAMQKKTVGLNVTYVNYPAYDHHSRTTDEV